MARIRSVHPGLFTDEGFTSLSDKARMLFIGILTECDDAGIFEWRPVRIKIRLFPADDANIPHLLEELVAQAMCRQFDAEGKSYGAIRNFCKWQRPKMPKFEHPAPDDICQFTGMSPAKSEEEMAGRFNTLRKILWERDGGCCVYCGVSVTFYAKKTNSLEIDHRIPRSRGGTDDLENLACACRECNSLKADMTAEDFSEKFSRSELNARHAARRASQSPNGQSQSAKGLSENSGGTDAADGGGRMEEGKEVRFATAQRIPPRPPRGRGSRASQNGEVKEGEISRPIGEADKYRKFLTGWHPGSFWPRDVLGPPPSEKDCRAPPELLREFGLGGSA